MYRSKPLSRTCALIEKPCVKPVRRSLNNFLDAFAVTTAVDYLLNPLLLWKDTFYEGMMWNRRKTENSPFFFECFCRYGVNQWYWRQIGSKPAVNLWRWREWKDNHFLPPLGTAPNVSSGCSFIWLFIERVSFPKKIHRTGSRKIRSQGKKTHWNSGM